MVDVITAITRKSANEAAEQLRRLIERYPDVKANCFDVKFPDARGRKGQKATATSDAKGTVEIIMLLQGRQAASVRRQAAALLCRFLGGDISLVDEVCALRGFQEEMAVRAPEDPRRVFGEAVEATGGTAGNAMTTQLARASGY